ncbi:hypothetical protein [Aureispira anguillae]|nr:hypothetical protein [Aureispira anguillae]
MHYFLSSMVLPFWMMLLIQPSLITRQLDFIQKEEQLQKLALLIQAEGTYQLLSNYKLMDLNRALNLDTAKQIQTLLRETAVDSFQLGHGCISFYLKTVSIRYYYHKNSLPYAGDQKIKDQWYWLDTSP